MVFGWRKREVGIDLTNSRFLDPKVRTFVPLFPKSISEPGREGRQFACDARLADWKPPTTVCSCLLHQVGKCSSIWLSLFRPPNGFGLLLVCFPPLPTKKRGGGGGGRPTPTKKNTHICPNRTWDPHKSPPQKKTHKNKTKQKQRQTLTPKNQTQKTKTA